MADAEQSMLYFFPMSFRIIGKEKRMGQKEAVSKARPCEICGRADGDFRLITDDGYMLHWCFRTSPNDVCANGRVFKCTGHKQTSMADFSIFMEMSEYEAQRAAEKKAWLEKKDKEDPGWRKRWVEEQKKKNPDFVPRKPKAPQKEVPPPPARKVQFYEQEEEHIADDEMLDKVYRSLLRQLKLEPWHREKLRKEWQEMTDDLVNKWQIKSLPPLDILRKFERIQYTNPTRKSIIENLIKEVGEPKYVPGFYLADSGLYAMPAISGILYPIYNMDGKIIRLRIADDYPEIKGTFMGEEGIYSHKFEVGRHVWYFQTKDKNAVKTDLQDKPEGKASNKYKNFSSFYEVRDDERKLVVNKLKFGAKAKATPGIYYEKGDDFTVINITEGEKKSIISNYMLARPTIALPGVGSWNTLITSEWLDKLVSKGTKEISVIYDADKNENELVLKAQNDFVKELKERNIDVSVGEWNPKWGKGLDDVLLKGIIPQYHKV